eukprot:tig00000681_g3104.t1
MTATVFIVSKLYSYSLPLGVYKTFAEARTRVKELAKSSEDTFIVLCAMVGGSGIREVARNEVRKVRAWLMHGEDTKGETGSEDPENTEGPEIREETHDDE